MPNITKIIVLEKKTTHKFLGLMIFKPCKNTAQSDIFHSTCLVPVWVYKLQCKCVYVGACVCLSVCIIKQNFFGFPGKVYFKIKEISQI